MPSLATMPPRDEAGHTLAVVEVPRGSNAKLKYDARKQAFLLERVLPCGLAYPYDWGFVPGTNAEDGDPLDIMVLSDITTWPGVLIPSQPIGLVRVLQEERSGKRVRNDRVIAVPASLSHPTDVSALPSRLRDELAWFFKVVGEMNKNWVKVESWEPASVAEREIDRLSRPRE